MPAARVQATGGHAVVSDVVELLGRGQPGVELLPDQLASGNVLGRDPRAVGRATGGPRRQAVPVTATGQAFRHPTRVSLDRPRVESGAWPAPCNDSPANTAPPSFNNVRRETSDASWVAPLLRTSEPSVREAGTNPTPARDRPIDFGSTSAGAPWAEHPWSNSTFRKTRSIVDSDHP